MQNPEELWQANVNGEIYDTTFAELTQWIAESSLLDGDKVRKGNLRWLEAGRVPPLRPFFDAKANGTEPPVIQFTVSDASDSVIDPSVTAANPEIGVESPREQESFGNNSDSSIQEAETDQSVCNVHPEIESLFICEVCAHGFCKTCPESYGSSVNVCPYCGGLCRSRKETLESGEREERIQRDISDGFGFGDFAVALGYPLRFKSSLFFGGLIVAVLGYAQSAAGIGSYALIGAAIVCFILSTAFVFGMLSNTVDRFAKGEIGSNFLPSFEDFSAWDDVVHPFLLAAGAFLSSFGLAVFLTVGFVWYAFTSLAGQIKPEAAQHEQLTKQSDVSAGHINAVKQKLLKQNQNRLDLDVGPDGLTDAQRSTLVDEAEFQELSDLTKNYKKAQLESVVGKSQEDRDAEMQQMLAKFGQTAGVFIIFIGLAVLWGCFYFPAACAVAAYTRSFGAAMNPLIGLDTIKHLGVDYIKILAMAFIITILSGIAGGILGFVFSPFDLPALGNLPAKFAVSFVSFYFWVAFAVVIGLALYKNSDKLKLSR